MHRALTLLLTLFVLTVAVPLMGCPKNVESADYAAAKALAGTWQDESGGTYTIGLSGKTPEMLEVVDYDGEVFQILATGMRDGLFYVTYLVPSTQYTVDITITDQPSADTLSTAWRNQYDSGDETWTRVQ